MAAAIGARSASACRLGARLLGARLVLSAPRSLPPSLGHQSITRSSTSRACGGVAMAAPSAEERALLERGVRAVLSGWAALQLAVAQGFGGPQSPEKAAWLVGAVLEFLSQNPDLAEDEVEEFLAEVMDNEFDTAVEDGSLRQVSRELLSVLARVQAGDVGGVGEVLTALALRGPALSSALANAQSGHAPGHAPDPAPQSPGTSSEEEEEAMECGTPAPPSDGWTLVRRRRR